MTTAELKKTANEIRKGIVKSTHAAKSGHPGGSLSAADVFTYLYFVEMNVDPENPKDEDRDRFVLSKGHVAPGYYATLAERGFFPKEDLLTLRHVGSYLQGHPDMKKIPGVDMSAVLSDRESQQLSVWHWLRDYRTKITAPIHFLEMARFRKVRFGKPQCLQERENWITWS